jgi:hypothetical protein
MNDVSIDLSAIVEEENDTKLLDILNVTEKIDDNNSNSGICTLGGSCGKNPL